MNVNRNVINLNEWSLIRQHYVRLTKLHKMMNEKLSWLIIQSFVVNIYYLVMHSFQFFRHITHPLEIIYSYTSILLLVLRLSCVCIYCSQMNVVNIKICSQLNQVPSNIYNFEVNI